ncbi:hypothetical protein QR680_013353 [Steinernema hermaphroditum]|uniref:Thiamin pyrophosphokinase thiamin-binding domain-containing protein n=1 Tax=Steinernema hermaphroditum TaxID=289476 RepID=A0AA39I584_9BILA|nr:hypothetical protein QR680_013353 [Steinernema hermaphroditum]
MGPRVLEITRFLRRFDRSAVVFVNGPSAFRDPLPRVWLDLWNGAPLRFCLDGAANRLHVLCRDGSAKHPTTISGDFDSLFTESRAFFEASGVSIVETRDQNETDMTKALRILASEEFLKAGEIDFVVFLGGFSGRFDHTMASIKSMLVGLKLLSVPIVAFDESNLVTILPEGQNDIRLERSLLTGICGFIPFCQRRVDVTTRGFKWNLKDEELSFDGIISTSNELVADRVEIHADAPILFTVELKGTL